jgi:hypothetical protein
MKPILLSALLLLSTTASGHAQSTPAQPPKTTSSFSVSSNDSAMIILPGSTQSLTPAEVTSLRSALYNVYQAVPDLATAQKALMQTGAGIAAGHGASSAGPYSITGDFSVQITVLPPNSPPTASAALVPSWTKVATQGQTVLIKAGTTVRFGAPAGAAPANHSGNPPLAKDAFDNQVTYKADAVITINPAAFGGIDPAPDYTKELDMLGTTGSVTVVSAH